MDEVAQSSTAASSLLPISNLGVCGLANLGTTCFINSTLQLLSNTPPLTEFFLSDAYLKDINAVNPLGREKKFARPYAELIKALWSERRRAFSPGKFNAVIGRYAPQFRRSQHDTHELMAFLLAELHEDLNRVQGKPAISAVKEDVIQLLPVEELAEESWASFKRNNDSIIVDTFHSQLKSTLVCPECNLVSVNFEPSCYLSLPLAFEPERPINFVFVPAISKRLTVAEMRRDGKENSVSRLIWPHPPYCSARSLVMEQVMIPKSSVISDMIKIIANALNKFTAYDGAPVLNRTIDPAQLHITGASTNDGCILYYAKDDTIPPHIDELVVLEEDDVPVDVSKRATVAADSSGYVLPVFILERRDDGSSEASFISRPFLINVKRMSYENIREAIYNELVSCLLVPESFYVFNEAFEGKTNPRYQQPLNQTGPPFTITLQNKYDSSDYTTLLPGSTLDTFLASTNFLAVNIDSRFVKQFFSSDLNTHRQLPLSSLLPPRKGPRKGRTHVTLDECIQQFMTIEKLGSDNLWNCLLCKKPQMAYKKIDIWSLPKILIIHLKRFLQNSRLQGRKLEVFVDFPVRGLDMTPYVLHNPNRRLYRYNLIGVSNHFGDLYAGHYTTFARNCRNGLWYNFDDSRVSKVNSKKDLVSKTAYVLFYQLQDEKSSISTVSEHFVAGQKRNADSSSSSTSESDEDL